MDGNLKVQHCHEKIKLKKYEREIIYDHGCG